MAKRSRQAQRSEGRSYSSCLCLFGVAILLGLACFQLLDVPLEPRPKIAANVAVEVVVTGPPVPAPPAVSVPAVPTPAATAAPVLALAPGNGSDPDIIWYSLAPREPKTAEIDLVIAAFSEDLSWIDEMMAPVASSYALRLYCKGDRLQDPRCLRIHNFGGEEYAYLTHITHFYDDLAPITIFTLGSIYDSGWHWLKCRKLNFVLSYLDSLEKRQSFAGFATMAHQKPDSFMEFEGYFKLDRYRNHAGGTVTDSCKASVRPLEKWFETFIYNVSLKKARHTGVLYNPIFAVSRERIRQYPKSMYERLLREILRCTSKAHEGVAEAGHYLERAWKPMFESDMPDAIKCSGHFGQKKGDEVCCNQSTPSKPVRIELPWTICREGRPRCSGMVDGSGWGTCMPAELGERVDLCPEGIRQNLRAKKIA